MVYTVSLWAASFSVFALLICSLIFCLRRDKPLYLRVFLIYAIVNPIPDLLVYFFPETQHLAYMTFSLFELGFFTYFLTLTFFNKRAIKLLSIVSIIWILRGLLHMIPLSHLKEASFSFVVVQFVGESIILVAGCCEYIREIMGRPTIPVLSKEPAFWMISAMLFYFITLAPTMVFTNFAMIHHMPDVGATVFSVNNFCQIFTTILFIIGMTCKTAR